jgi:hypothetical protein
MASAMIHGVERDAEYVAERIAARRQEGREEAPAVEAVA